MPLRLYDTLTRSVRDFTPLTPGGATMYVCGPTVQAQPHIGHARSAIVFDILRRWLEYGGTEVTLARNVTDIDDKIIHAAQHSGEPWWALAERNTRAFTDAYDALNVKPPTVEPRATGHVPEMITLMHRLIDRGHAYAAGGDVYFDVRSLKGYGALSGQRPDEMLASEKAGGDKHDALDFALWKGAKADEPSWPTPWGDGRPGWHLECSAMATKYLGPEFDIHGGGLDLVFPHHENEVAQSTAAGDGFARFWVHHALVNVGAEKMSKSLGNSLIVADLLERARPAVVRYYLGSPHYRSALDWTEDGLREAESALGRIANFLDRAGGAVAPQVPGEFAAAMDDDLAVPRALAVLHDTVRRGNTLLAEGHEASTVAGEVRAMCAVLGVDIAVDRDGGGLRDVVDALVRVALDQRAAARSRKDFAAADAVRDQLAAAGVTVEDTPDGPRWTVG
ncbi:MAG: cysteinyl-tRNA synthetase [Frankiales bacterium]|nr:cysteinyl-tRNA synthetase [Frankiales bacterium]